jgi:hypothetical protein
MGSYFCACNNFLRVTNILGLTGVPITVSVRE